MGDMDTGSAGIAEKNANGTYFLTNRHLTTPGFEILLGGIRFRYFSWIFDILAQKIDAEREFSRYSYLRIAEIIIRREKWK